MKKLLSLVLAVLMALSLVTPFAAWAKENEDELPVTLINPFLTGEHYLIGDIDSVLTEKSSTKKFDGKTYYGQGKQLFTIVKKKFLKHEKAIKVRYLSDGSLTPGGALINAMTQQTLLFDLMYYSTEDENSTSCIDGDYLRYSLFSFSLTKINMDHYSNGNYYYTLNLAVTYNATENELKKVDSVVNEFVNSIDTNKLSDYEIIKKIHDYICKKNVYDYDAANYPYSHPSAFSPYGALVKGRCVCQGYATAFYRLCKELGYKARVMASTENGGNHAWNIVELDGKFYVVDCTWDDQIFDEGVDEIPEYYYFLTSYTSSLKYDSYNEHVFDPEYFDTDYFYKNYRSKMDSNDYDRHNLNLLSRSTISLSQRVFTYDGSKKIPAVTVKTGNGEVLKNGSDYTLSYGNNTNTGYPYVVITGRGDYENDRASRRYYIKPSKAGKPSAASGAASVKLKWTASPGGVTGYTVETYQNGEWQRLKTVSTNSALIDGLSPAKKYRFRIRAYKRVSKRKLYGDYSAERVTVTKPKQVKGLLLGTSKRKLHISFNKAKVSGYIIRCSEKKNMKGAKDIKLKSADRVSKTLKKLKSGKRYYVRVRAYNTYELGGKKKIAYGKWSAKKSIKIK